MVDDYEQEFLREVQGRFAEPRYKSLKHTKEGDFIQTVYREYDDTIPPPLFYRGKNY